MRHLVVFLLSILTIVACQKDTDDAQVATSTSTNDNPAAKKNQSLEGKLYNQDWQYQSAELRLDYLFNQPQSFSFYLYDSLNYDACYDFGSPFNTAELVIPSIPPRLGRFEIGDTSIVRVGLNYRKPSGYSFMNIQNANYGYIEITEMDTAVNNTVKFYLYLNLPFRDSTGSTDDIYNIVEGWVEGDLCRTPAKRYFKDQPLSGKVDGQDWTFQGGIASYLNNRTYLSLYNTPKDTNCQNFNYGYPDVSIEISSY